MNKTFLADDILGKSTFIQAKDWDEAEKICKDDRLDLVGEYVGSSMWWDMPKWLEPENHKYFLRSYDLV